MLDGTLFDVAMRSRAPWAFAFGLDVEILGRDLGGVSYRKQINICPSLPNGPM